MPAVGKVSGHRRREGTGVKTAAPPWMVTFSDLVTQILVFFVLLFASSTLDVKRFEEILSAFRASMGILETGRSLQSQRPLTGDPSTPVPPVSLPWAAQQIETVYQELARRLSESDLADRVELVPEARGLVVRLADRVLFDLGKADLRPEARAVLDTMAGVLKPLPNPIRVEGHTDDLPIRTDRFPSNWELSTARATAVVRYLIEQRGFGPQRLSAAGYGEHRPLVPNTSAANRQRNRRVDLVILRLDSLTEQAPPASRQP